MSIACEQSSQVHPALRAGAILGVSAVIASSGLLGAVLVLARGEALPAAVAAALSALPMFLGIRLACLAVVGFHRWSIAAPLRTELWSLVIGLLAGALLFAATPESVPAPIHVLELLLTTVLLVAFRIGPRLAEDFPAAKRGPAAVSYAAEGPRRALNVLVAAVAIALTFPVWLLIALAIKVTSRGPVFYLQERVGLDRRAHPSDAPDPRRRRDVGGRPFKMVKFRTMAVDAENGTGAVWAKKRDPRVIPIGGFLRHTRLDELPQLINVLKGDMNIVGPRPERPSIFADLRARLPNYALRQRARPGITGYAQVNLEADTCIQDVENKLRYDLQYLERQGVVVDLLIMAKTVLVMLFRDRILGSRVAVRS